MVGSNDIARSKKFYGAQFIAMRWSAFWSRIFSPEKTSIYVEFLRKAGCQKDDRDLPPRSDPPPPTLAECHRTASPKVGDLAAGSSR